MDMCQEFKHISEGFLVSCEGVSHGKLVFQAEYASVCLPSNHWHEEALLDIDSVHQMR